MKHSGQLTKIIWAIDAFGEEKFQLNVAAFLRNFTGTLKAKISPVFILSMSGAPGPTDKKAILDRLAKAEEGLHGILKKCRLRSLIPEKILVQSGAGFIRNDVKALLAYAKSTHAQAIVVSTHAKKGVERLFMGSFAETLLLSSTIPIMSVNPSVSKIKKIRSILFATDFGPASQIAFKSVLIFARQLKAKVIIFHQQEEANEAVEANVLSPKEGKWSLATAEFLQETLLQSKDQALAWQKLAKTQGVSCSSYFGHGNRNIADSTIETALKTKADMIAIASRRGPIASTFIGSTARWLVRSAPCPVWVLHVSK
ncbi:MAG: hypothetical protein A2X86_21655 [Bdellovibrionales bacterium GWA2_49_15]|nr:MAG: hypothetical protein A2X86_21655 [Bdellovibrionales bacterium GWA2_49_15]HAZ11573.1 hypothetical protein [Bdellovibrionales bacterium]